MERIRQHVRHLEQESQREARLAVEGERDGYHGHLTAMLRERCLQTGTDTDEDLDRKAEEAARLESFDDELRQLLQGR